MDTVPQRGGADASSLRAARKGAARRPSRCEETISEAVLVRRALVACWHHHVAEVRELVEELPFDLYAVRGNLETDKPPYMSFPGVSLVDAVALGAHIPETPPPEEPRRELLAFLQCRGARFSMPTLYHDFSGVASLQTLAEMGVLLDEIDLPSIMLRGPAGAGYVANLLLDLSENPLPWRHRAMLRRLRPPRPILNRDELRACLAVAVRAGAQCPPFCGRPYVPGPLPGDADSGPAEARAHFQHALFGADAPEARSVAAEPWAADLVRELSAAGVAARVERAWLRRRGALLALRSADARPHPGTWAQTLVELAERGDDLLAPVFAFV